MARRYIWVSSRHASSLRDPTAIVPEARVDMPTLPIRVVGGKIARALDETEAALAGLQVHVMVLAGFLCQPIVDKRPAADRNETEKIWVR